MSELQVALAPLSAMTTREHEVNSLRATEVQDKESVLNGFTSCFSSYLTTYPIIRAVLANKFPLLPKHIQVGFLSLETKNLDKRFPAFASTAVAMVNRHSSSFQCSFHTYNHLFVCLSVSMLPTTCCMSRYDAYSSILRESHP